MVIYCVAFGCKNEQDIRKLSFHGFPFKRPGILELWIEAVHRENWTPSKTSKLCGEHFLPTDYIDKPGRTARLLKPDAVPSIFAFTRHLPPKNTDPDSKIRKLDDSMDVHNLCIKEEVSQMDIDLPMASSSQVLKFFDKETQTISFQKDMLLRRNKGTQTVSFQKDNPLGKTVKTLRQKVKRRDLEISKMKEVVQSISNSVYSNDNHEEIINEVIHYFASNKELFKPSHPVTQEFLGEDCYDIQIIRKIVDKYLECRMYHLLE
ncbi:unnamed protein product [Phaedon cochleariae]|uniref:THAP-type domain-containing protein n=1 Tax=Phaedon cochleariae TaxID=80249 RepID=A0A9N9S864_PHACE|nr:unnamed protein product [Phaedon cochleariae]